MFKDHEFDPVTPEEEARRRQEEEFARRVRREVLRIERGEADEDIRADMEREEEEKAEEEERQRRERRRKASTFWQLFSGTILVHEGVSKYYPYMLSIAGMFFLSIAVMFTTLHLDMKYSRLEREVQILRERSISCRNSVTAAPPTRPSSNGCANAASSLPTRRRRAKSSKTDGR